MRIFIIFLLFPFFGSAQINVEIILIDCETAEQIEGVNISLGDKSTVSQAYSTTELYDIDIENLRDILFLDHEQFLFQDIQLIAHEYSIIYDRMRIVAYGQK